MAYGLAFVYFLFKLAERIHHFIEIRLPAEIHFSHFLVGRPQSIFEMFTRGQEGVKKPAGWAHLSCSDPVKTTTVEAAAPFALSEGCVPRTRTGNGHNLRYPLSESPPLQKRKDRAASIGWCPNPREERVGPARRNESRDIHMPRGALNTEGPKHQSPFLRANGAR
jgi:hypothetical protein